MKSASSIESASQIACSAPFCDSLMVTWRTYPLISFHPKCDQVQCIQPLFPCAWNSPKRATTLLHDAQKSSKTKIRTSPKVDLPTTRNHRWIFPTLPGHLWEKAEILEASLRGDLQQSPASKVAGWNPIKKWEGINWESHFLKKWTSPLEIGNSHYSH